MGVMSSFIVTDTMSDGRKPCDAEFTELMNKRNEKLKNIIESDDNKRRILIKELEKDFHHDFRKDKGIFSYFNVYYSAEKLGKYILSCYEDDEMLDLNEFEKEFNR